MPPPVQIAYKKLNPPVIGLNNWQGFLPRTETLKEGTVCYPEHGSRPLPCDIDATHDFEVKVRDGCSLYCDIYRPSNIKEGIKVPAIVAWSPFGKKYNGLSFLPNTPFKIGVPEGSLSGLERFEGPDPAEFVPRGYAVVNVDARGAGHSDGDVVIMGSQEGEDGYDVIEEIAKLPWCNGNVGLAGNSHLAIVQWHIAMQQPPSLKCIAPWEACGDLYREQFVRGGNFDSGLFDFISKHIIRGRGGVEDFAEMHRRSPTSNAYWKDKRADFSKIKIPTFISVSYTSFVHVMGSIRGWMEIPHNDKWIRFCAWQEWYDLWAVKETSDELDRFFSRYLKEENNGWEKNTPKVRSVVLRFGLNDPYEDIIEDDFPIPRTEYKRMYLAADGKLIAQKPRTSSSVTHESTTTAFSGFTYTFPTTTRLVGLPKAVLYMSCPDSDDMVVFVTLRKLDKHGVPMLNLNIPWSRAPVKRFEEIEKKDQTNLILAVGFMGVLRASHREIDESKSMHKQYPFHPHENVQKIPPGEIVRLEIGIWAMGVEFEAGESIRVQVSGSYPLIQDFEEVTHDAKGGKQNIGNHLIHFGGNYDSQVILPFV